MDKNPAVITLKGLKKSYGETQALRGVDLEVLRGELYGFLGPNGAGKTTTIRCMLDLIRPQAGTLRILGLDPRTQSREIRARTGYLPGELSLEANLKVSDALRYLNQLRGNRAEWETILQLASRLDLDVSRTIKNLSKGNKQKVGLIQALMHKPELLLLDEPTSGLDPLIQRETHALLKEIQEQGTTIFFSSHNISEVEAIADRVGIIRGGVIIEEAEPGHLKGMDVHRIQVRFMRPTDPQSLGKVAGVTIMPGYDDLNVAVQVEGELDLVVKALAAFPISDMVIERPSLEEVFLAFYKNDGFAEKPHAG